MAKYIKAGNTFRVCRDDEIDVRDLLPVGTYAVKFDKQSEEFFLQSMEAFTLPEKMYGDVSKYVNRIFTTFRNRNTSTGVCLSGTKGSGKTLITKSLSVLASSYEVPTIVVAEEFHGDAFNKFIQDISQEALIVFDEFEKQYSPTSQEKLLTLLDGVYTTKKLFILTCNDSHRVDANLKNRPGRIFYSLDFDGISHEVLKEYCEDKLENPAHIGEVMDVFAAFPSFTFDMLQALVEEMNRYKESAADALKMLNVKLNHADKATYDIVGLVKDGKSIPISSICKETRKWQGNPLSMRSWETIYVEWETEDKDDTMYMDFSPEHLVSYDKETGQLTFVDGDNKLVISREPRYEKLNPLAL